MSLEPEKVSEEISEDGLGSLRGCLVEGDSEQRRRERRIRRRALVISILLQSAVLTMLILIPLFGKTERLALGKDFIPMPPYGHRSSHPRGDIKPRDFRPNHPDSRFTFHPPTNKPDLRPAGEQNSTDTPDIDPGPNQPTDGPDCSWCVDIGGKNKGPRPPEPAVETHARPRVVQMTSLDPAMLIHRVEPAYPPLARQIHKEGRVELHAIIGTDGTIQSLQIVAGDPLFHLSARDAVQQWRYRPTILNGQPVEVDTYITVIYTMQH
jgi:periplasmic protein TonB